MDKKQRVLVTGTSGFIGSHLIKLLSEKNIEVTSLNRQEGDIRTLDLEKYGEQNQIVHLANMNFIPASWENPGNFFSVNIDGTRNILEFCRKNKTRLIYISSYVYGRPNYLPIDEKHPLSGINPYMKSKIIAEELVQFYHEYLNVPSIIIRPFNIFGKGQSNSFLIPTIVNQLQKESSTIQVQSLKPKRDFLHINDFNKAIYEVLKHTHLKGIYNVGSGKSYSVQEIINGFSEILDHTISYSEDKFERTNEVMNVVADISKIMNDTNWSPSLSLKEGLSLVL